MLVMGGVAADEAEARGLLHAAIRSGRAAEVARRMVAAQGGDPRAVDDPSLLPATPVRVPLRVTRAGVISAINTHAVGIAAVALGAGRGRAEDVVDPAVGFVFERSVGDAVREGEAVVWVHAADESSAADALARLGAAITVGDDAPADAPLLIGRVG
jgi:pyrimidine-nucleoside phosphorylase